MRTKMKNMSVNGAAELNKAVTPPLIPSYNDALKCAQDCVSRIEAILTGIEGQFSVEDVSIADTPSEEPENISSEITLRLCILNHSLNRICSRVTILYTTLFG